MSKLSQTSRTILQVSVVSLLLFGAVAPVTSAVGHPGTDNTVTRIDVQADGSAKWTVQIRTRLDTNESIENYERFQSEFRQNKSQLFGPFKDRIERIVSRAANETGRPMAARNFSATTSIQALPRRWGVVTFSFTWDEFANQQNGDLVVGDTFESGFFIAENDSIQIAGPDGYGVADAQPTPDEKQGGTVVWTGRQDFTDNRPYVRFSPDVNGSDSPDTDSGGSGVLPLLGGALVLALVGGGIAYKARQGGDVAVDSETEPLTDDDRVLQLLEANGGRMKQSDVVAAVDWSESKVSRVTAKLADEDAVKKTQIGRENVIELDRDSEES